MPGDRSGTRQALAGGSAFFPISVRTFSTGADQNLGSFGPSILWRLDQLRVVLADGRHSKKASPFKCNDISVALV